MGGFLQCAGDKKQLTEEYFDMVAGREYPDRMKKLQEFVDRLSEEDNPVIVIAHLKKEKQWTAPM